ncbi:MAG TPA: universal stress protein [Bryobacteraceae bacterium]|nr:universal stress protein [Bryobacteraceae bacterium]
MHSISKILLPVDFSERSEAAGRYARALAARFDAELILLHVLTPPQYEFGPFEIAGPSLTELYRERAQQVTSELEAFQAAELAGVRARQVVLEGDPSPKIVEFAHAERADLIVMPTHGYGPFRRFILGSNTAKVLHDADCPVWTGVHLEQAPPLTAESFRSILCAVDLGAQSSKTLCWAAMLAGEFDAKLTVIHVTAPAGGSPGEQDASWSAAAGESARRELERLQSFVHAPAELAVESGEAPQAICAAAERVKADALVIGRGSAAGVFGRLRTNAYAIIRQSPCPVVSV